MAFQESARSFSREKHRTGDWQTTRFVGTSSLTQSIAKFVSFKRDGVDRLARKCAADFIVGDIGAGNGAYDSWFLSRCACTVLAIDWSPEALAAICQPRIGRLWRICADSKFLPLKSEKLDALYTIDTLGHIAERERALDEILRVTKGGAPFFIHSECGDYRKRWPDKMTVRRIGYDFLADRDGHVNLLSSTDFNRMLRRRFIIEKFYSPAGLLGWLLGHPDKYTAAFRKSGNPLLALLTNVFAFIKKTKLTGAVLRLANALSNHLELFLGIEGGGSCFAEGIVPKRREMVSGDRTDE